jgi:hypothetical protein
MIDGKGAMFRGGGAHIRDGRAYFRGGAEPPGPLTLSLDRFFKPNRTESKLVCETVFDG